MATAGDLVVNLGLNSAKFASGISGASSKIASFASKSVAAMSSFGLAAQGANTAINLLSKLSGPVKLAADAEQTQVALEVMLDSASQAKSMIGDLRDFAAKTPFGVTGLTDATKTLLGFGITADQVMPSISMLSEVAAGDEQKLSQLALVFGQISAAGRLTGGDVLQLINAGFNPLQQIAARTGESMIDLKKRMEAGKVSFDEVKQAFVEVTSAGGRFYQMNDKQSKTLSGMWSTFQDDLTNTLLEFGKLTIEGFNVKASLEGLTATAKTFTDAMIAAAPDIKMVFGDVSEIFGRMSQDLTGATNNVDAMRNSMVFVVNILKQVAVWIERIQKADFAGINNLIRMISGSGMAGPGVKPTAAPKTPMSTGPATTPDARPVVATPPPPAIPQFVQDAAKGITDKLRSQAKKLADELQTPVQAFEEKVKAISPLLRGSAEDQKLYNDAVAGLRKELRESDPLWKAAKELFENTRTPLEQFNATMAQLDAMARKGAPRELLDRGLADARKKFQESDPLAKAQKAMREDAKKYAEAARTPTQVFQDEIAKLKALRDLGPGRGGISQEVFNKSALAAEKEAADELAKDKVGSKEGVGAIEAGSAAAFSAIAGAMRQKEEVKQLQKIEGHLREMARKTQPATVLSFGDV